MTQREWNTLFEQRLNRLLLYSFIEILVASSQRRETESFVEKSWQQVVGKATSVRIVCKRFSRNPQPGILSEETLRVIECHNITIEHRSPD